MERVETIDDVFVDDVRVSDSNFLKYYHERPDERFYSGGKFDAAAIVLYERDLQDIYDETYLNMTGKLPSRRLVFRDPQFKLRSFCMTHDLPVVERPQSISGVAASDVSPITRPGVWSTLYSDLGMAAKLAEKDAAEYKLERLFRKKRSRLGIRGYMGVCLCAVAGTALALWLAYGYMQREVDRRVDDFKSQFNSVQSEVMSHLHVDYDSEGNAVLTDEMEQLLTYVKAEVESSTNQELRDYFSVSYDAEGRPVFNEDLEDFFAAARSRLDSDFNRWIERFKNDEDFRNAAVDALVDALMDD